jgi:hypothetical protein
MRKHFIKYKDLIEKAEFFREIGEKYSYERSGHSVFLKPENGLTYYAIATNSEQTISGRLPIKEIGFIKTVKDYILRNNLHKKIKKNYQKSSDILFFDFDKSIKENEYFKDSYSVDIKSAYWKSALNMGFIDDSLYQKGLTVDKRVRLACLGTFAKKIYQFEFDGQEEKLKKIIKPKYPHVFMNQANLIYWCMDDCKKEIGSDFIFFWTDGIYVKTKEAAKKCEEVMKKYNFEAETNKLIKINRKYNGFETTETDKTSVARRKKKIYKINLTENKA